MASMFFNKGIYSFANNHDINSINITVTVSYVITLEPPFLCDYIRNGYCKHFITSMAESKRVFFLFFLNHKLHTENED